MKARFLTLHLSCGHYVIGQYPVTPIDPTDNPVCNARHVCPVCWTNQVIRNDPISDPRPVTLAEQAELTEERQAE